MISNTFQKQHHLEMTFFDKHVEFLNELVTLCKLDENVLLSCEKDNTSDNESEQDNDSDFIEYFLPPNFNKIILNKIQMLKLKNNEYNFLFTIDKIEYDKEGSGCHQCNTIYPKMSLEGYLIQDGISKKYEGHLDTWNSFSCYCENRGNKYKPELLFRLYFDNKWDKWEFLWLCFNIGYTFKTY